jgi:hypothetical protein
LLVGSALLVATDPQVDVSDGAIVNGREICRRMVAESKGEKREWKGSSFWLARSLTNACLLLLLNTARRRMRFAGRVGDLSGNQG